MSWTLTKTTRTGQIDSLLYLLAERVGSHEEVRPKLNGENFKIDGGIYKHTMHACTWLGMPG